MTSATTLDFLDRIDVFLDTVANPVYFWLIGLFYVVYLAAFFGVVYIQPTYIHWLTIWIQVFISVVLLIRFNPFRKHASNGCNHVLIFACASFLLLNVCLTLSVFNKIQSAVVHNVDRDVRQIDTWI